MIELASLLQQVTDEYSSSPFESNALTISYETLYKLRPEVRFRRYVQIIFQSKNTDNNFIGYSLAELIRANVQIYNETKWYASNLYDEVFFT